MSRLIKTIALLFAIAWPTLQVVRAEELIDYKAALSTYLQQSQAGESYTPKLGQTASSTTPPTNTSGTGVPTPPSTATVPTMVSQPSWAAAAASSSAVPRNSDFVIPSATSVPTMPSQVVPVQAVQSPAGSPSVTEIGSMSGAVSAPAVATNQVPAVSPAALPQQPGIPTSQLPANFAGMPAGTFPSGGIVEQNGALYQLEPVYDDGATYGGEVPFAGLPCGEMPCNPCGVEECGQVGCQQCCSSLCGCRQCGLPVWLRGELLLWGVEGDYVPPLLTRSPAGTPGEDIGVLGRPTTRTVFGGDRIGDDLRVGGRLRGGIWLNKCRKFGIDGDFFYLGQDNDDVRVTSAAGDYFARPFFNTNPAVNAQDSEILVAPRIANSVFEIENSSTIYSAAPTFRWNAYCCECTGCCCEKNSTRVDFLAGYRYFRFDESIRMRERFEPSDPFFAPGTSYEFFDSFETENEFHGAEIGMNYLTQRCRWIFDATARIAFGNMNSVCNINGYSRAIVPGVLDQTVSGGFLTAGSRLGTFERDEFAVIPQGELSIGYCVSPTLRFHAGYNFMFLHSVIRPGGLIPTRIDSDDFLVDTAPSALDEGPDKDAIEQSVWLQGVTFGFTYNF